MGAFVEIANFEKTYSLWKLHRVRFPQLVNGAPAELFTLASVLEEVMGKHPHVAYVKTDSVTHELQAMKVMCRDGSETTFELAPGSADEYVVRCSGVL